MLKTLIVALSLSASALAAQERFDFYGRGPYRADVPRPASLLGYEPGRFHTDYAGMERVVQAIAQAAPDRVRVFETGRSEEHRRLWLVAVSSPENIRRLGEIKAQTARLADPRTTSAADARTIIENLPSTVWLNYANDGDESAAFEAGIHTLWHYAASNEPATLEALRQTVILIRPAHNPESHERFVSWYNAFGTGASNPSALEHDAPWGMETNNNHYQIDLNRDALVLSQRESRDAARLVLEWHPQVFIDHHGQLSQFFFPPAALPVNQNVPARTARWMETFGRGNADAFDRYGWPYYVRDVFDLFYAGYWDSWPALQGATGMTFETDGGGGMGLNWRREDGSIGTLEGAIAKHFVATMATVETAGRHRAERLQDYYDFRRTGMEEGARETLGRVLLVPGNDPLKAAELVEVLLRSGVEVGRLTAPLTALAQSYDSPNGRPVRRTIPAGAYVVDLNQPQKRMARAILEPNAVLDSAFVREQFSRRNRNARRGERGEHEGYQFYDVTAWALPYTFGVESYWTAGGPAAAPQVQPVTLPEGDDAARQIAAISAPVTRARSAYLFANDRNSAGALAMALLGRGYRLGVATRPMRADGRTWPRGTFVLRTERNNASLHDSIGPLAQQFGVPVAAAQSAWADSGAIGLSGEDVRPVRAPRILVAAGDDVSITEYGALWFLLERVLKVPFTPVRTGSIANLDDLDSYNVLIFPGGSPGGYEGSLGENGVKRIAEWIERGGVFIGWQGGARFAMRRGVDWTSSRIVGDDSASSDSAARDTTIAPDQRPAPPIVSPTAPDGSDPISVPGAIFRVALDQSHWLTFGYEQPSLQVIVSGSSFFKPSREGSNAVVFTGDSLHTSGFIWPGNTERLLRGTAWAVVEPKGSGSVVLFSNSPVYRLFWRSTYRMLQNAILFGPSR